MVSDTARISFQVMLFFAGTFLPQLAASFDKYAGPRLQGDDPAIGTVGEVYAASADCIVRQIGAYLCHSGIEGDGKTYIA